MAVLSLKSLPLGYRFRPTDEELIDYYLRRKINGNEEDVRVIREVDVCKWEPFELPDLSVLETNDKEWFFFCPRDQKYPNGLRLNRATAKGYWKATGKDRKIKSRTSVIGMKKTLVFYRGRAPKGKRTNWVMHEYRTTLEELDGTHPGQGAYVLCRLFEKNDEKIEGSHSDEVEPAAYSPTMPKSSPEDSQSEIAEGTPLLGGQAEKQPAISESCLDDDFDRTTPETLVPAECQTNNDADDQEVTATEMDPRWEECVDMDYGSILEPEDCKLFSPLHSQMRAELGSCYMHYPVADDFSNVHNGLQLQSGTNEQDSYISEFLNSIINNSDENCYEEPTCQKNLVFESGAPMYVTPVSQNLVSVKDRGSCSESDTKVAQAQLNVGRSQAGKVSLLEAQSGRYSLQMETTPGHYRSGDNIGAGIRIRTRWPQNQPDTQNIYSQGTAQRRIRLQSKLEVGPLFSCKMSRLSFKEEDDEAKSTITEEEGKAAEKHTTGVAYATTTDEPQKIFFPESDQEVTMNARLKFRSKSNVPKGRDENIPSVFAKTPACWSVLSSVCMFRVAVVIVLFIFCIGIRRCLKS